MLDTSKADFESAEQMANRLFEQDGTTGEPFALIRFTDPHGVVQRQRIDNTMLCMVDGVPGYHVVPRQMFMQVVRQLAAECNADLYMMVSEAWVAPSTADTIEEAAAQRAQYGNAKDMPGAREVAIIYLEDMSTTELWMANIIRGGSKAKLTPFRLEPGSEAREGAVLRVLPHLQQANCN